MALLNYPTSITICPKPISRLKDAHEIKIPMKLSNIVVLFQLYGVVTTKSIFSVCWTITTILLTIATIWKTFDYGVFSPQRMKTLSTKTHMFAYFLLLTSRSLALVNSLWSSGNFEEILEEFDRIDSIILKNFGANCNSRRNFVKLLARHCTFLLTTIVFPLTNLAMLDTERDREYWFFTMISIHITQVKVLSVVFLVDLLNHRLELLNSLKKFEGSLKIMKLHSRLFSLSKLINGRGIVLSLITLHQCNGLLMNYFWIFSILFHASEQFMSLYRKLNFKLLEP